MFLVVTYMEMITGKLFHDLGLKKEVSSMELAVTRPLYIDLDFEVRLFKRDL